MVFKIKLKQIKLNIFLEAWIIKDSVVSRNGINFCHVLEKMLPTFKGIKKLKVCMVLQLTLLMVFKMFWWFLLFLLPTIK